MPLTLPAGTPLTVRLAGEISSGAKKAGDRFQRNLDQDLVAGEELVASRGARVYGRVAQVQAGTGMGTLPALALVLTDIEIAGRVVAVVTGRVQAQGEAKKPGKKILGGAARLYASVERAYREFRKEPADAPWDVTKTFDAVYEVASARGIEIEL